MTPHKRINVVHQYDVNYKVQHVLSVLARQATRRRRAGITPWTGAIVGRTRQTTIHTHIEEWNAD